MVDRYRTSRRAAAGGGGTAKRFYLQPWLTLYGPTTVTSVLQPCRHYLDGLSEAFLSTQIEVTHITNVTLVIESATNREGPWSQSAAVTGVTDTTLVLSSEGGPSNFSRYVRWRLASSGSAWEVAFQLLLTSGAQASESNLTPIKA